MYITYISIESAKYIYGLAPAELRTEAGPDDQKALRCVMKRSIRRFAHDTCIRACEAYPSQSGPRCKAFDLKTRSSRYPFHGKVCLAARVGAWAESSATGRLAKAPYQDAMRCMDAYQDVHYVTERTAEAFEQPHELCTPELQVPHLFCRELRARSAWLHRCSRRTIFKKASRQTHSALSRREQPCERRFVCTAQ
jgi:hypothetical protein